MQHDLAMTFILFSTMNAVMTWLDSRQLRPKMCFSQQETKIYRIHAEKWAGGEYI